MYVISSRVYMYGCVLCNRVYIYICMSIYTQTFYTGQENGMFTRQLSSHAIYRLFFSNDPRHVSPTVCTRSSLDRTVGSKEILVVETSKGFSTMYIYVYRYRYMHYTSYISQIFLLIQSRPTLCVVYLCPRDLLKRRHGFSPSSRFVSFLKETKKENVRAQRCKFTRHFGDSFSLTRELALVSGGDLLITYFQVTLENHGIQTSWKTLEWERMRNTEKNSQKKKTQAVTIWCVGEHRKPVFCRHCTASCVSLADLSRLLLAIFTLFLLNLSLYGSSRPKPLSLCVLSVPWTVFSLTFSFSLSHTLTLSLSLSLSFSLAFRSRIFERETPFRHALHTIRLYVYKGNRKKWFARIHELESRPWSFYTVNFSSEIASNYSAGIYANLFQTHTQPLDSQPPRAATPSRES